MKYITLFIVSSALVVFAMNLVNAADILPDPAQLTSLFQGKTVTITNGRPADKRGGPDQPVNVYFSEMGILEYLNDEGESNYRKWTVSENGLFCVSRNFKRKEQAMTCGTIVGDDSGEYRLYKSSDIKVKSGQVVGMKKKEMLLIFSNFVTGKKL